MKTTQQSLIKILFGILAGSTVYVIAFICGIQLFTPTRIHLLGLVIVSGLIGLLSWLMQSDYVTLRSSMLLHLIATLLFVVGGDFVFHWQFIETFHWFGFLGIFAAIYIIIWLIWYLQARASDHEINEKLREWQRNSRH